MAETIISAMQRALAESTAKKADRIERVKALGEWEHCPPIRHIRDAERRAPGFIDHTGARLGRLTVWGRSMDVAGNAFGGSVWVCRCDCGRFVTRRHKAILKAASDQMCSSCREAVETESRFAAWCDQIDALARKIWPEQESYTHDTGRDCWREAFDLGQAAEDAWHDECNAVQ